MNENAHVGVCRRLILVICFCLLAIVRFGASMCEAQANGPTLQTTVEYISDKLKATHPTNGEKVLSVDVTNDGLLWVHKREPDDGGWVLSECFPLRKIDIGATAIHNNPNGGKFVFATTLHSEEVLTSYKGKEFIGRNSWLYFYGFASQEDAERFLRAFNHLAQLYGAPNSQEDPFAHH